ncbi:hypothetical protein GNI_088180 [Gregarina niphandrodes]|uniref:Uncharacterized protein n=1 Tax=Gregarina niphandrodes TaxID=110365 RepID=A0A023B609_GRENI|nr:hypothetical protein GNI_088180 [Gregarina niphandrodes]EZG62261.1 hypothetical protein GNI_088180 [Gregarina niphandrodes]|eukprot:XP_011130733.1 hypothetical protein GNI_088180 [Gregarina niphandrodes]
MAYAHYFRALLDVCEDIATDLPPNCSVEQLQSAVDTRVVAAAVESAEPCRQILAEFQKKTSLPTEHYGLLKMQELARIAAGTGLGKLTPTTHLTTLAYKTLLDQNVISKDEFLAWIKATTDEAEHRAETLSRVIPIAKKLTQQSDGSEAEPSDEEDDSDDED